MAVIADIPNTAFRTKFAPYFNFLRKRSDGILMNLDEDTIFIRKENILIGWVNEQNVISPLYNERGNWVIYFMSTHVTKQMNFPKLQQIGVFEPFEGVHPPRLPSAERRHN